MFKTMVAVGVNKPNRLFSNSPKAAIFYLEKLMKVCKRCIDCNVVIDHRATRCPKCSYKKTLPFLGKKHSKKTRKTLSNFKKNRKSPKTSGNNHWNWQGGISTEMLIIRKSIEYKIWREAVYMRDNYTCQKCGLHSGNGKAVSLEAHHKKRFSQYPELRFVIDNGQTLCKDCHDKTKQGRRRKNEPNPR